MSFAGFNGVELKDVNLMHDDSVEKLHALAAKHKIPITGSAFAFNMWDPTKHDEAVQKAALVISRLSQLGGELWVSPWAKPSI